MVCWTLIIEVPKAENLIWKNHIVYVSITEIQFNARFNVQEKQELDNSVLNLSQSFNTSLHTFIR